MLSALMRAGVDIRPEQMGVTWDDVAEAMRTLRGVRQVRRPVVHGRRRRAHRRAFIGRIRERSRGIRALGSEE